MKIQSVITGDIVNSTRLGKANMKKLQKMLEAIFAGNNYEFYRGDSFQVVVPQPEESLRIALLCRSAAIGITGNEMSDIKLSIGIGKVDEKLTAPGTAKSEAFIISGRELEDVKSSGERIKIASPDVKVNISLQLIAEYVDSIFLRMTSRQAKVIYELLQGSLQQDVVKRLKKSKSTISQHASSGRWNEIEKILKHFEEIIKYLIH